MVNELIPFDRGPGAINRMTSSPLRFVLVFLQRGLYVLAIRLAAVPF
jgi:hypothetical protein